MGRQSSLARSKPYAGSKLGQSVAGVEDFCFAKS